MTSTTGSRTAAIIEIALLVVLVYVVSLVTIVYRRQRWPQDRALRRYQADDEESAGHLNRPDEQTLPLLSQSSPDLSDATASGLHGEEVRVDAMNPFLPPTDPPPLYTPSPLISAT